MPDDAGRELLQLLRGRLVALLGEALGAAEGAGALGGLGPGGPQWDGTALEGHLLAPLGAVAAADPLTAKVLEALEKLSAISGPGAEAGVFGWEPDVVGHAQPRGLACALRVANPGPAGGVFAAALAI